MFFLQDYVITVMRVFNMIWNNFDGYFVGANGGEDFGIKLFFVSFEEVEEGVEDIIAKAVDKVAD